MGLLMLSTLLDFTYGFSVASPNRKKAKFFLWLGIINNLGILGIFKYYNFFAVQFQQGLEYLGLHTNPVLLNIALPVGISFYTFHGMSYVFDIYRGQQKPVRNFIDYAVFVSFFPLLVAGPIERASHLLPQVQKQRTFNYTQAVEGCRLMLWGMFKKVVIADNLAVSVDEIYSDFAILDSLTLVLGAIYFSFQIYCDFSGYTDIARGIAKLFGFELLLNFANPYISESIPEFWKKWHISLTSWFRDYLYIPLGGSRYGKSIKARNTIIVFLLSGFWHGANWTFIFWGLFHSIFFLFSIYGINYLTKYKKFNIILNFIIVTLSWILFRSKSISEAIEFYHIVVNTDNYSFTQFLGWRNNAFEGSHFENILILILFLFAWFTYKKKNWSIPIMLILVLVFGNFYSTTDFIYFQF
jgi:D-alanyl-lipoteichoic acid acyltransferase DltB (MBOAT superfamily)